MTDRKKQVIPGLGKLVPFPTGSLWKCVPPMSKLRPNAPGFKEPAMGVAYTVTEGIAWLEAYRDDNLEWIPNSQGGGKWVIKG